MNYKIVELEEGVSVQYLGVYVLKWRREWGEPEVGFVEVDDDLVEVANDLLSACKVIHAYLSEGRAQDLVKVSAERMLFEVIEKAEGIK